MKQWVILFLVIVSCLNAPAGLAAEKVYLANHRGAVNPVTVDDKTTLIAVTTWCPHCNALVQFLKDPQIASYTRAQHLRIVFVLADERRKLSRVIERELDKQIAAGKLKAEDKQEALQANLAPFRYNADIYLYNAAELKQIPGEFFLITPASKSKSNLSFGSIPKRYSEQTHRFDEDAYSWIQAHARIPENVMASKIRQYDP